MSSGLQWHVASPPRPHEFLTHYQQLALGVTGGEEGGKGSGNERSKEKRTEIEKWGVSKSTAVAGGLMKPSCAHQVPRKEIQGVIAAGQVVASTQIAHVSPKKAAIQEQDGDTHKVRLFSFAHGFRKKMQAHHWQLDLIFCHMATVKKSSLSLESDEHQHTEIISERTNVLSGVDRQKIIGCPIPKQASTHKKHPIGRGGTVAASADAHKTSSLKAFYSKKPRHFAREAITRNITPAIDSNTRMHHIHTSLISS